MGMLNSSRSWITWLILLALAAFAEWQFVTLPPAIETIAQAKEDWVLPYAPQAQPEKAIEILATTSPWGKLPEPGEQPSPNDPEWRFLGIMARGEQRYVLIKIANQPEQQLTVGDRLPGGSKILEIEDDSLCLLVNGKKRTIGIHSRGPRNL